MGACVTALIVVATIFGPITLVFIAVSFGTDNWLEFNVDRSKLTTDEKGSLQMSRYTHTRNRGLFRECYPGNDTAFLDQLQGVVDDYCFNIDYELPDNRNVSDDFLSRIHLLRLFLAFYIISLVFFVAAYVFGLILCCWRVSRWAYIAGLCAYIAAFSVAAAIAFFHGAEYLERNKLTEPEFYNAWSSTIKAATRRNYGWSYALGWVGMILAAITATFYSLAGCYITSARYEDRERFDKDPSSRGRDYPIALEPMYAVEDPYVIKPYAGPSPYAYPPTYGHPRAYTGPYILESPRYAIGYGSEGRDLWTMREMSS